MKHTIKESAAIAQMKSEVPTTLDIESPILPPSPSPKSRHSRLGTQSTENKTLVGVFELDFAACATGRTITISWACKVQRLAMNSCMNSHATREEQDAAREEWFANMGERKRLREEKEKKKKEQEKFHREWWGLPPLPDEEGSGGQVEDGKR